MSDRLDFAYRVPAQTLLIAAILTLVLITLSDRAQAEYGDVVLNRYSDEAGIRPVIFPHWFHRIRYRCKTCHSDLGFQLKAGANDINMFKIINGDFCGACHNGKIAWSVENCDLCHSAASGTPTQVHKKTTQILLSPPAEENKP